MMTTVHSIVWVYVQNPLRDFPVKISLHVIVTHRKLMDKIYVKQFQELNTKETLKHGDAVVEWILFYM